MTSSASREITEQDRRFMAAAVRLGRRCLGMALPTPIAGTMLVGGDGTVLLRGSSHSSGSAILEAVGPAARGATLFTTFEPSPDDAATIVGAGVQRVVTAMDHVDPRLAGRGHAMMRDAGVAIFTGVLTEEARRLHSGFLMRAKAGRPHVTLKLAVSADGMIGQASGERITVSGSEAFARLQAMRIEADATLIGIGTALVNDPSLTVRLPNLAGHSPVRIVLDSTLRLSAQSALVRSATQTPLWIVAGPDAPPAAAGVLAECGAVIMLGSSGSGGLDLGAALGAIAERNVTRLLVEGGARIAGSLVGQGLVDEVVLFHAPVVVGANGIRALAGRALSAIERSPRYQLVEELRLGDDRMVRYEKVG